MTGNNRTGRIPHGFTKLEVLVTIGVVWVGLSVLLMFVCTAPMASQSLNCINNLRAIGTALEVYHDVHGSFPPGAYSENSYGWGAHLLPSLGRSDLAAEIDLTRQPMEGRPDVEGEPIYEFLCPADEAPRSLSDPALVPFAHSSYRGMAGSSLTARDGMLFVVDDEHPPVSRDDVTDGVSQTLIVGEAAYPRTWEQERYHEDFVIWAGTNGKLANTLGRFQEAPRYGQGETFGAPRQHESTFNVLFADGRATSMARNIDPDVFRELSTRASGNPLDESAY